jgi:hypothetical protein
MVLYSIYIVRLRWHLEKNYPVELEKLNLGKKISRVSYYTTPRQAKNVMSFIFSDFDFNDLKIKGLKIKLRIIIYLSIIWLIALILFTFFLAEGH